MLFTDHKNQWDPDLLTDPRVEHYWDSDQEIGRWFDQNEDLVGFDFTKGPIVWDSFFLFGSDATWDAFPTHLVAYGNTVTRDKDLLLESVRSLLEPKESHSSGA